MVLLGIILILILFPFPSWAADWYVRPVTGEYGLENGKTYATAFDGFAGISWGTSCPEDKVCPGDTLFICGTFHGEDFNVGTSGTVGNPINIYSCTTVLGASNDDPGTIWAGQLWTTAGWAGPDGNGVYNRGGVTNADMVVDSDLTVLYMCDGEVDEAACCAAQDNSWYRDGGTIYYHPGTGGLKDLHFYQPGGPAIDLNEKSYITIKGLTLYMGNDAVVMIFKYGEDTTPATNVTIDSCTIGLSSSFCVRTGGASNYTTLSNNLIFDCAAGFYNTGGQPDNVTISGNEFYHTSNIDRRAGSYGLFANTNGDLCAIATSTGGANWSVTGNYIHDWKGEGIYFYVGSTNNYNNASIRRNRVFMDSSDNTKYNMGIGVGGDNEADLADRSSSVDISYNIIKGAGLGSASDYATAIRSKLGIPTVAANKLKVYNNTIYDCYQGFYGKNNASESEIGVDFRNNIISTLTADGYFINIENITTTSGMTFNKNIYYGTGKWKWDGGVDRATLLLWQGDSSQDANSLTSDPLFVTAGTNFYLQSGSPAINAGDSVGLTTDYAGRHVPKGAGYDIGAYEYGSNFILE